MEPGDLRRITRPTTAWKYLSESSDELGELDVDDIVVVLGPLYRDPFDAKREFYIFHALTRYGLSWIFESCV